VSLHGGSHRLLLRVLIEQMQLSNMPTNTNRAKFPNAHSYLSPTMEKVLLEAPITSPTILTFTVDVADHNPNRMPDGVASSQYLWMQSGSPMRLSLHADQEQ
jgi:hypothetical protein